MNERDLPSRTLPRDVVTKEIGDLASMIRAVTRMFCDFTAEQLGITDERHRYIRGEAGKASALMRELHLELVESSEGLGARTQATKDREDT